MCIRISPTLILVDQIVAFGELERRQPDFPHTGRGVLVDAEPVAQNFGLDDLEFAAGACQFFPCFQEFGVVHVSSGSFCPIIHGVATSQRPDAGASLARFT